MTHPGDLAIAGGRFVPLRKIPDERGIVMHMLRSDDPHFERYGEIYFSTVYPGAIRFKGIGTGLAIVANCASIPHDPAEITRADPFTSHIPYDWSLKHG